MRTFGLRWLWFGLLWVMAAGCGGSDSPTTPTPVTPNFAGTWVGTAQLQQCTGNATACAQSNPTTSVEFVLTQSGTAVSGTWTLNAAEPRVAVTGSVAADGSLNLSGRPVGHPAAVESSRLTVAGAAMSGTLTYTFTLPDPPSGNLIVTAVIGLQGVTRR